MDDLNKLFAGSHQVVNDVQNITNAVGNGINNVISAMETRRIPNPPYPQQGQYVQQPQPPQQYYCAQDVPYGYADSTPYGYGTNSYGYNGWQGCPQCPQNNNWLGWGDRPTNWYGNYQQPQQAPVQNNWNAWPQSGSYGYQQNQIFNDGIASSNYGRGVF